MKMIHIKKMFHDSLNSRLLFRGISFTDLFNVKVQNNDHFLRQL